MLLILKAFVQVCPGRAGSRVALPLGGPAYGLSLPRDEKGGDNLATIVDRVSVRHVRLQSLPVGPLQHRHATGFPAERERSILLVVEQPEHDAVVVHAVGLRGDVAGQHTEIDSAIDVAVLPEDRVNGHGLWIRAVGKADDVATIVHRLRLNLPGSRPRRLENRRVRRAGSLSLPAGGRGGDDDQARSHTGQTGSAQRTRPEPSQQSHRHHRHLFASFASTPSGDSSV